MQPRALQIRINLALGALLALNLGLWFASSDMQAKWAGVPPVPRQETAVMMALGDGQFSFRSGAITLQNLGDTGGRVTPLKEYSYAMLGQWFALLHLLDPASDHIPMAAAYYFGATPVKKDVRVVVDYLGRIGQNPYGEKWRWLAHAAYLARHKLDDLPLALDLAYKLSRMQVAGGELPLWARQMPAFILKEQGERDSARDLIEQMLATEKNLHPNEVNFMAAYLTEQLGIPQAEVDSLLRQRANQ